MAPSAVPTPQTIRKDCIPALIPRRQRAQPETPLPVPATPSLPEPPNSFTLVPQTPTRRIISSDDHEKFLNSLSKQLIVSFIFSLAESCRDKPKSAANEEPSLPIIDSILGILEQIGELITDNPPEDQGNSRFGNPAFRGFIDAVSTSTLRYHQELGISSEAWIQELSPYLESAFGSRQRIDYGSGHELNFAMWLLCLNRLSLLPVEAFPQAALLVFPRYISLLRDVQSTYYLEPAGSHGVWGLDDYQFLPFLFGASQLVNHPYITPRAIHNDVVLEEEADEYMYLDMVRYTMSTKTVKGLKWTQPMLDDISGAKNWQKVEQGMRRMFDKEVLGKLPIMQHFLFGSLIPAVDGMSIDRDSESVNTPHHLHGPGHVHRDNDWGDCCGIKIPSTVAAGIEAQKHASGRNLRRVPFD